MGRWYLGQLANGSWLEDAAFLDLQIQEDSEGFRRIQEDSGGCGGASIAAGLVVFQQPEMEVYQRLMEAAQVFYQGRDRLRLLVQFRKAFIDHLLAEGEEAANAIAGDYQREAAEKDREYDSTALAREGKRELNAEETERLKQLWKKRVRIFYPDLHEHDPEKLGNFGWLGGRVTADSWTTESFLRNDGSNWRWHIFTGK